MRGTFTINISGKLSSENSEGADYLKDGLRRALVTALN